MDCQLEISSREHLPLRCSGPNPPPCNLARLGSVCWEVVPPPSPRDEEAQLAHAPNYCHHHVCVEFHRSLFCQKPPFPVLRLVLLPVPLIIGTFTLSPSWCSRLPAGALCLACFFSPRWNWSGTSTRPNLGQALCSKFVTWLC